MKKVVHVSYRPNKKQTKFHVCGADEVIFAGGMGAGKTAALVMEAFMYGLEHPGAEVLLYSGSIYCDMIDYWKIYAPEEIYEYNYSKMRATVKNGTRVYFRCREDNIKNKLNFVGVDKMELLKPYEVELLKGRLLIDGNYPSRFRATFDITPKYLYILNHYVKPTKGGRRVYKHKDKTTVGYIEA